MKNDEIPEATLERLPLYYRTLQQLEGRGFETVSSQQFAGFLNIKPEKLRKDLAFCGSFGTKGIGYVVTDLKKSIGKFLGLQYKRKIGIVGASYLGIALASDESFAEFGFEIAAIFDKDPAFIGNEVGEVKIYDFEKLKPIVQRKQIDIGVIAVPKEDAQEAADSLVAAGVKGLWNFASIKLFAPNDVAVVDADLSFGLSILNYFVTQNGKKGLRGKG